MHYGSSEAKAWRRKNPYGYITIATTPFTESGDIDEDALRRNVEHILVLPRGGLYLNKVNEGERRKSLE